LVSETTEPRIWLLIGDKLGDNAQIEALVESLGQRAERKNLFFKEEWRVGKPAFRPSLYHLDRERSDNLAPPWPDLIMTIGRRPAMAALWVKRQSGGQVRLVLIGRPKRYFDEFDLVIGTGQYHLPDRPNVLRLPLPLMRPDKQVLVEAAEQWRERLEDLPRPLTAVLVGGPTKPFRMGPAEAAQLLREVAGIHEGKGTIYISTSRRTPADVIDTLERERPVNSRLFRWRASAEPQDNPYSALLASADRFVVTADSISMLTEAIHCARPVAVAPLPVGGFHSSRSFQMLYKFLADWSQSSGWFRHALYELGLLSYARDFRTFHENLRAEGVITFLSEGFHPPRAGPADFRDRAAEAVRRLLRT